MNWTDRWLRHKSLSLCLPLAAVLRTKHTEQNPVHHSVSYILTLHQVPLNSHLVAEPLWPFTEVGLLKRMAIIQ